MREQLWKMAMVTLMALFLATGTARAEVPTYSGGSGTKADPYLISNLGDLKDLSEYPDHWNLHFRQTANIDAAATAGWDGGAGWSPIGNNNIRFRGTYDGCGFTINGLHLDREGGDYQGFFGSTQTATIKHLGLISVNIRGRHFLGGLAGSIGESTTVANSYSKGSVSGTGNNVGGLIGVCSSGYVINSYSTSAVSTTGVNAGGLVGLVSNIGSLVNCYSRGDVSGGNRAGGFVGRFYSSSTIVNSYSTGAVSEAEYVGGFVAYVDGINHSIIGCLWDVDTSGQGESAGIGATGISTVSMKTESTFTDAGWKFPLLWAVDPGVNDGYPHHTLVQRPNGDSEEPEQDQDGVYLIKTLAHLLWIAEDSGRWGSEYHYRQVADIDATDTLAWHGGEGWSPIGNSTRKFEGTYDGGGFTIDGLFIFRPAANYVGLFGHVQDGTIRHLGLRSVNILGGFRVAGLVGSLEGTSSVDNCYSRGAVSGTFNSVGGLAGSLLNTSSIANSYSTGAVSGPNLAGGIVGVLYSDSTVVNSYSVGNVSATYDYVGGIAGRIMNNGSVYNSYSRADVSGNKYVGGLVGRLEGYGSVFRSYSTGGVSETGSDVGGFVGSVLGTNYIISNCFWDKDTSGQDESAGVGATGKSIVEMKTEATFTDAGWIFPGAWVIDPEVNDGYPHHVVYSLIYSPSVNGSIRGAAAQIIPYGGNGSPVEAVPGAGYLFIQWSDGVTDNPRTEFNVTATIAVTAEFTVHLKYVIAVLQVLSHMEPQVDIVIDDGPVGIPDAVRLLQRIGEL